MEVVETLNREALLATDSLAAQQLLEKALDLLQYHANCGKTIDRNLIITIIYNLAGVNQALCNLERAAQYLEGVVFNMQEMIEDETNQVFLIKRMHLLTIVQLQYCGILSQLGQHSLGQSVAKETILLLNKLFQISQQYQNSQSISHSKINKYQKGQYIYQEYDFKYLLLKRSEELLKVILQFVTPELISCQEKEQLKKIGNQIFCWRLNQNEKILKQSFSKLSPRSMIGLLNENEWLSSFDISNVMHIRLLTYQEVCLRGEILYEFSQKVLVEKTLLLSVAYFSLATETRYLKLDSELYHLKAIFISYNILQDHCPYLDHLVGTFLTHYHQELETIQEEQSFADQSTKVSFLQRNESLVANKENTSSDHIKLLIESMSKNKAEKQESIKRTINQLQTLKTKLNKQKSEITLKRFKTEPSIHFEKNDKNCRQILSQLMKQQ